MGMIRDGLIAFRGRRFVEWLFTERPSVPFIVCASFYTFLYFNSKYDLLAQWKGQRPFDN